MPEPPLRRNVLEPRDPIAEFFKVDDVAGHEGQARDEHAGQTCSQMSGRQQVGHGQGHRLDREQVE